MSWKTNKKKNKNLLVSFAYWAKDLQKRGRDRDLYSVLSYRYQLAPSAPHFREPPAASLLRDTGQKSVWSVRVHFTAASGASGCLCSACRRQSAIKNERFGKPRANRFTLMCRIVRKFDCSERERKKKKQTPRSCRPRTVSERRLRCEVTQRERGDPVTLIKSCYLNFFPAHGEAAHGFMACFRWFWQPAVRLKINKTGTLLCISLNYHYYLGQFCDSFPISMVA